MSDWMDKRVIIIGAARQGTALARWLAAHGAHVVINDKRTSQELEAARTVLSDLESSIEWVLGSHPLEILEGADLVCPSGGVSLHLPLVEEALRRGIPLSNDSQIFLENVPCPVIGITGSAGKTTTTTLVGRIASAAVDHPGEGLHPRKVWTGGNIGAPLIASVDSMQPADLAVMELSSFQLELTSLSPQVAAVLNVTPNHLDRHASMEEYAAAKRRILDFQSSADTAVLGRDDPSAWAFAAHTTGRLLSFGLSEPAKGLDGTYVRDGWVVLRSGEVEHHIMPAASISLRGEHNLLNVLAAAAISAGAGLPLDAVRQGVEGFTGVAHRLEFVRELHGASWYNDSIATAPERAMADIRSFDEPLIVLAGGKDKNLPWSDFARLVCSRVDHLVLFGEAAPIIDQALAEVSSVTACQLKSISRCKGLREAVETAAGLARPGDVVLLSPGGTSFDEFRDFEERGEVFRQWVMKLR